MTSTGLKQAPQPPPTIPKTNVEILEQTEALINQCRQAQDRLIRDVKPKAADFANTIGPLAEIENSINIHAPILTLYEVTSTHLDAGKASSKSRKLLNAFRSDRSKSQALYDRVHTVWKKREDIDLESRRLIERLHENFIRNGLNISDEKDQMRYEAIQDRIGHLATEFRKNRTADAGSIWFTLAELDGAPQDVLSKLKTGHGEHEGKVRICLDDPVHCDISVYLKSGEVRKRFEIAERNKCLQNVPLLKEAAVLRNEAARLLGYKSHAALKLQSTMAKTPETVNAFLLDLRSRLLVSGREELGKLKELKRADMESRGEAFDGRFYSWDYDFYNRQLVKKVHLIDKKKVAEYFEMETTVKAMLKNFERLFGLKFRELEETEIGWDNDVKVYSAWDEDEMGGEFLGYLYLDLFAREGKDGGNFNYTLEPGFIRRDGKRHYPSTVLFCSFNKPTPTKPCLLSQHNLVVLFHELGHGIHNLVSKTKYSQFHGTQTALDFGEAPSQMLEHWCWTPSFLSSLGRHYSSPLLKCLEQWKVNSDGGAQPPAQIPMEMVRAIISTRYSARPNFLLGQVMFAMFDMKIHHPESQQGIQDMDLIKVYNYMIRDVQMFDISEDRNDWGSFFVINGHLMDEYDAGYYSYLFSEVYSTDMFDAAFKEDITSREEGRRYRGLVLEKGGGQDEITSLRKFLGRDPSMEAFYRDLGLG